MGGDRAFVLTANQMLSFGLWFDLNVAFGGKQRHWCRKSLRMLTAVHAHGPSVLEAADWLLSSVCQTFPSGPSVGEQRTPHSTALRSRLLYRVSQG